MARPCPEIETLHPLAIADLFSESARNHQPTPNMPYYELEITARKTVCVKADNPEDARHTAIMECTAMEWEEGEADVIDDYANGENPKHREFIERYKLGGEYYETEYNEDVPPSQP